MSKTCDSQLMEKIVSLCKRRGFVFQSSEIYGGLNGAILTHPAVLKASGHVEGFSDPIIDCRTCNAHLRTDQVVEKKGVKQCPNCGGKDLTAPRQFNLMFETHVGAATEETSIAYL